MSKQDPIAEALSDLLDEPLSPRELARASESIAAAEVRAALGVRQALKDLGPDGEFVAQLEAQLLAGALQVNIAKRNVTPLAWLRRVGLPAPDTHAAPPRRRRLVLVLSGITSLLVLALAAVILIPLLGGKEPTPHGLGSPVWNPTGVNGGLSAYVLSDTISVWPSAPSRVPLFSYSPQSWDAGTTRRVADLARSLGLRDPFTVTVDQSTTYTATDGTRMVSVRGDVISYVDSSVQASDAQLNTGKSLEEGQQLVERFLKSCGFLDFPYRAVAQGGGDMPAEVSFVRLADGRQVQNEFGAFDAHALVVGNRIADASFISYTLEPAGDTAILSAEEAWQALQQNRVLTFRLFTAGVTQQITQAVSTPQAQPSPTPVAPPVDSGGRVNAIEGWLSAVIYEYPGVVSSTQHVQVSLSEWYTGTRSAGGWSVELRGAGLRDVAQYDRLRLKVWGRYDAASRTVDLEHYEKADPTERVQGWLGVVTSTVMGDGVMRSFFNTQDGQRFLISDSLNCPPGQAICLTNAPTDRVVIMEGAVGQERFDGVLVLYLLSTVSGDTDMSQRDLAQRPARPYVVPVATSAPQPAALAPNTPPYLPGNSVEGVEGYLHAWLNQDEQGRIVSVKAELSVLPLTGNTWGARLGDGGQQPRLRELAQYDGLRVRLWGHFTRDEHDQPLINVERYEKVDPAEHVEAWLGTLITGTVQGRTVVLLQTREGERFVLAVASSLFSPAYINDDHRQQLYGKQVVQEGVLRPELYGGYRIIQDGVLRAGVDIDRMTDLKDYQMQPHPFVSLVANPGRTGVVEQVELIYYAPGETASFVTLRPTWRFWGYTSDGGLFEALVDAVRPDTTRVTLDVFSGRPNPTWTLSNAATSELKGLLANAALTPTAAAPLADGALGYRGMLIDLTDATTGATQHFRVFKGVVAGQDAAGADPLRRLERWLLRSGVGWFDSDLYAQLSQEIDSVLPHPRGCPIYWDEQRQRMVEPCLGSEYEGNGTYVAGPSLHDMVRFPARLNGARIEVDVTRPSS